MKIRAPITTFLLAGFCLSCAEGQRLTHEEAATWVTVNRNALMTVVETIESCDGQKNNEFNRIFADGTAFTDHCHSAQSQITDQIENLNIAAVAYHPIRDRTDLAWLEFDLYLSGIVTSGTSVSVIWYEKPHDCNTIETFEEHYTYIRKPLFDNDCQWLFETETN